MEIKNIGFLVKDERIKSASKEIILRGVSETSFNIDVGCTLYGIKQRKGGAGRGGVSRCIVNKLTDEKIGVISFNLISGEKICEVEYDLCDVVIFPVPVLIGLSGEELGVLKGGAGFPDSITKEHFATGEKRPEFIRNLEKFSPLVRTTHETEE
jgi:hypothetical protein